MKKQTKKLMLAKETLRNIDTRGLERVIGRLQINTYPWTGQDTYSAFCTQSSTYVPPETTTPSLCNCEP
jgi:hypothetical protein